MYWFVHHCSTYNALFFFSPLSAPQRAGLLQLEDGAGCYITLASMLWHAAFPSLCISSQKRIPPELVRDRVLKGPAAVVLVDGCHPAFECLGLAGHEVAEKGTIKGREAGSAIDGVNGPEKELVWIH